MRRFGLVGRNISYSFSPGYFSEKFRLLGIDADYRLYDLPDLSTLKALVTEEHLDGFNVTIPFKEEILPYLDGLSDEARAIGAVNTVAVRDGKLIGHNTDWIGFRDSLLPLLQPHHRKALILGTGGASKAIVYALTSLGIASEFVSRDKALAYDRVNATVMAESQLVINCTPLGTYPDVDAFPPLPYEHFSVDHIAYDLVYNPSLTQFLKRAAQHGAATKNGLDMLRGQAEAAWEIWQAN